MSLLSLSIIVRLCVGHITSLATQKTNSIITAKNEMAVCVSIFESIHNSNSFQPTNGDQKHTLCEDLMYSGFDLMFTKFDSDLVLYSR